MKVIGTERDHHVLCAAHPKVSPDRIVQVFKGITGRQIFGRKPAAKRERGEEISGQMATR
jgi:hypothetical protein